MKSDVAELRRDYTRDGLLETQAPEEPLSLFATWFEQAVEIETTEANAMMLATVDGAGQPHLRTLLLKGVDDRGFVFFTTLNNELNALFFIYYYILCCYIFWRTIDHEVCFI